MIEKKEFATFESQIILNLFLLIWLFSQNIYMQFTPTKKITQ
jgi:hypothetical protein